MRTGLQTGQPLPDSFSSGPGPRRENRIKGTSLEPWIWPLFAEHLQYPKSFLGLKEDKRGSLT